MDVVFLWKGFDSETIKNISGKFHFVVKWKLIDREKRKVDGKDTGLVSKPLLDARLMERDAKMMKRDACLILQDLIFAEQDDLYEAPFTIFGVNAVEKFFSEGEVNDLLELVKRLAA